MKVIWALPHYVLSTRETPEPVDWCQCNFSGCCVWHYVPVRQHCKYMYVFGATCYR